VTKYCTIEQQAKILKIGRQWDICLHRITTLFLEYKRRQ